jgi:hypothetical protein
MSPPKKEAILGPMKDRARTEVRLPFKLMKRVDDIVEKLGVPKNAVIAMAVASYCVSLSPVLWVGKTRLKIISDIDKLFQSIVKAAKKAS